ncbi:hypothetical protein SAMD00019534_022800 [Acytostelium subglobosum LB1]|uniref:hypothetical protein n=1 Tax=Acytostelium subglobosum LB1 TaxID=1410327 RepID=UPI000644F3A4|nr:hypothetical protein SAMD00019534_022800 [Acytostelium subglobosum LB1]GAM19105.1 hypothetical protein SAMD00019534_022800 [Acytostelium subglobosum LB1]|eukprot:XP_012757032.1 hypothetical protein SAMD00019534_022800 [Acytostelium subglobosum LB1]
MAQLPTTQHNNNNIGYQRRHYISFSLPFGLLKSPPPTPPVHLKRPSLFKDTLGNEWTDNYAWMRVMDHNDTAEQEVMDAMDLENAYCQQVTDIDPDFQRLANTLYKENEQTNVVNTGVSFEEDIDGFQYKENNEGTYYRQRTNDRTGMGGSVQTLFVKGELGGHYLTRNDIMAFKFAEDNNTYSFVADVGKEQYHAFVLRVGQSTSPDDLKYQTHLLDHIEDVIGIEWGSNNDLYYTIPNELRRPHRLYRRVIGSNEPDQLIFEEPDDQYFIDISKSKDGKYLFFCSNSKSSSAVYYINLEEPNSKPKLTLSRMDNLEYYVDHCNGQFIVFANIDKNDLAIFTAPNSIEDASIGQLKQLIPTEANLSIRDVDVFQDKLILCELYNSSPRIRIISKNESTNQFDPAMSHEVNFPEVSSIALGVNQGKTKRRVRVTCTTPFIPQLDYDIDLYDYSITKYEPSTVKGALTLDPNEYQTKKVFVQSKHDTDIKIPMSLVYRKDIQLNSKNQTLIKGYGAYGSVMETGYESDDQSLLKRGWVIAYAHTRGGGELGRSWYDNGRRLNKKNTMNDFVDCVEYLFQQGYTSPAHLVARGSSAAGVIMGNMALHYPHYFSAIVAKVPFVDIISAMSDESLPLTIHEFGEWGNPSSSQEMFDYISSYDPYRIIPSVLTQRHDSKRAYPPLPSLLVTASLEDIRVPYWMPLKWVAKLRDAISKGSKSESGIGTNQKREDNALLLRVSDHGHFGSKFRQPYIESLAFELAFIIRSVEKSTSSSSSNNNKHQS